jgi:hypothetical protein
MSTGRRGPVQASLGRIALVCLLLLGVLVGTGSLLQAQERFGGITGVVKDESGGTLPGASVLITNVSSGRAVTIITDTSGSYRANDLEPGRYSIRFELSGFARTEVPDVNVLLGRTLTIDATMRFGKVTESVQVTSERVPLVDVKTTTVATNVTAEEFDRLPKARSFQAIALAAPSVNAGDVEGGFQVNGASGAENAFTIDGVVTNSLINGASRQNTVFEYLQEVQVKTTGISAEYGGALGGVISAVSKSGGNTTHGEVHYYFEGSKISAPPVQRLVLSPIDDVSVAYVQDEKQPASSNEFGGSIGGPLVKDRLFFFGSLSPRFNRRTNTYKFSNGTEQGDIKRKQTVLQTFGKVSYATNRFTAYGSVLYTPTTSTGSLPGYNGMSPNYISSSQAGNAANIKRGFEISQTSTQGNVDIVLTSSSFANMRGGYFYDNYKDTGIPETTSYTYQTTAIGLPFSIPAALQGPIGTQNTPRAQIGKFDTTKRAFFNADYNHNFKAGGWHTLKGGVGYQRTINDVDNSYPGGFVYIYWDRSFLSSATGATDRGQYGYYEVDKRGTIGKAGANIISLYAQDRWDVTSRLSIDLGLRTENEVVPSFRPDLKKEAIKFGFQDKLAPRLGVSVDARGDGKVKIYGSWGRYYDWTKYELSRGAFGGDNWLIYYRALDTTDLGSINLSNMPGRDLWNPSVPNSARDRRVPNFDTVDPALKPMSQDSTSAGVEMQLGSSSVLTVHYVHNQLIRTIEDLGALVNGDEVYYYANPGEGAALETPTSGLTKPFATPKPIRKYDAIELSMTRRFSKNWFASGSYVYSRLYGNYPGIAASDEITTPTTGVSSLTAQQAAGSIARPGGNVNRSWDIDEVLWDSHGNLDVVGNLATDRPHVVKLYGAYSFPFGSQIGAFFYGGSGTPISTYVNTLNQTQVFVNGRGDMGRTPILTRTDLLLSHEFAMAGSRKLRVDFQVLNVFNQKTSRHIFNNLNRGAGTARASAAINLANTDLAKGYDYNALIRASSEGAGAYDPRFEKDDLFEPGAAGQLTIKFIF